MMMDLRAQCRFLQHASRHAEPCARGADQVNVYLTVMKETETLGT